MSAPLANCIDDTFSLHEGVADCNHSDLASSTLDVLTVASPLRNCRHHHLLMTPPKSCEVHDTFTPGSGCSGGELLFTESPHSIRSVHYGSDDESAGTMTPSDGWTSLEDIYSFDMSKIAELARNGASLEELTEAIQADMLLSLERLLTAEQMSRIGESGDGTLDNVGIKLEGSFQCSYCRQRFETEMQLHIHDKFFHAPSREIPLEQEEILKQAVTTAKRRHRRSIVRAVQLAENEQDIEEEGEQASACLQENSPLHKGHGMSQQRRSQQVEARIQEIVTMAMSKRDDSTLLPLGALGKRRRRLSAP